MEKIELPNGVTVVVEDKTALLTADLYMVHLEFTTMVDLDENDAKLKAYCGEDVLKSTRVFKKPAVHEGVLEEVRKSMKDSYLSTNLPYLGHPDFLSRFKAKMLEDFEEEEERQRRASG